MRRIIQTKISAIVFFSLSLALTNTTLSAENSYLADTETFSIPGHGELIMQVPRIWNYNFTKTDENIPPLITFYILDKHEKEIFQLNMSVFTNTGYHKNITSEEYVKNIVTEAGNKIIAYSDQTKLILQTVESKQGNGYFFDLTDSNAKQNEFKYLTQGAVSVNEVLLVFSLFSNDEKGILREAMLNSLNTAYHINRKDI